MTLEGARTRVTRKPERARYDEATVHAIIDAAPICHVGFVRDGTPIVLPTIHAREGNTVYLHGSTGSGMLGALREDAPVCITVTLIDGLVFARSVMHHSMNYRSAVVLGRAREVSDPDEKMRALKLVVEHIAEGRWTESRAPNAKEFAATLVIAVDIDEASAKVRTGGPIDDDEDLALPLWAGVLPMQVRYAEPISATPELPIPPSVTGLAQDM